jgi:beta-glucosidase
MAHCSEVEGDALAQVLFGDYDPAGRLVETWPASLNQLPPMMDYDLRHGRTYMFLRDKPLYPFGYGLSYTRFKYSDMRASTSRLSSGGKVVLSVHVTNAGKRAGDEVVQMYAKRLNSVAAQNEPREELVAFQRISLPARESRTVTFELPAERLEHWDQTKNAWELECGSVRIAVGGSSADLRASKVITLTK